MIFEKQNRQIIFDDVTVPKKWPITHLVDYITGYSLRCKLQEGKLDTVHKELESAFLGKTSILFSSVDLRVETYQEMVHCSGLTFSLSIKQKSLVIGSPEGLWPKGGGEARN